MLIEFTVENYRSFKGPATLSMVAAKKLKSRINPKLDENNVFQVDEKLSLLTSAAIYGANASGKSNLIAALNFMLRFIRTSSKESQIDEPIHVVPFRLDIETEEKPSLFEIVFRHDGMYYRYGFEVTQKRVEREWLFQSLLGKEARLYTREGDNYIISTKFKGGQSLKSQTRPNVLFLSVAAQFNNQIAIKLFEWFSSTKVISGLEDIGYRDYTISKFMSDPVFKENLINLIKGSDLGINSVSPEELDINDPRVMPQDMPQEIKDFIFQASRMNGKEKTKLPFFRTLHNKKCENGRVEDILFDMNEESEGTQKMFIISGPIINALSKGTVLIIDEIEARFHTLLTKKLINLFNSPETNPSHAQLVFATHDTNLLSNKLMRRDQIWFMEKDEDSVSHLYSLAELKIRNDSSFETDYLMGRYGGIPILGEMKQTMMNFARDDEQKSE